ncbi:MAG TPA: hypothetical protein VJ385_13695 [Fibrobacteria bacterium]|nr:hypothetical protein [Fibrobacteria bacterium]
MRRLSEGKKAGGRAAAGTAAAMLSAALLLAGCKEDCSRAARMGDFEFSQGNYANAIKHYEKALRADAKCGVVGEKLAEAKRKASAAE